MRGLQPVRRVGRPQFARLHHEGEQPRRQAQEKKRITQPSCEGRRHRLHGKSEGTVLGISARDSVNLVKSPVNNRYPIRILTN
jgi:hypothetical protein